MPWFKIDDAFHGHPKVMELSPAAVGIWTLAGTWCANYLTDGEIKPGIIRRLGGTPDLIQELVDAGLWIDMGGAYQFKDWEDYQPMKADVEAERDAARERMRSVRAKKKGVERSAEQPPNVPPNTSRSAGEVRVTPSQPFPSRPSPAPEVTPSAPDENSNPSDTGDGNPIDTPYSLLPTPLLPTPDSPPKTAAYSSDFETAWAIYPLKASKKKAAESFAKALKEVDLETLLDAITRYRDDPNREAKFTKHFTTWLNQGCWEDEPLPARSRTGSEQRLAVGYELTQRAVSRATESNVFPFKELNR